MSNNGTGVSPANILNLVGVLEGEEIEEQALLMRLDIYPETVLRTAFEDDRPVATDEVSPLDLARALAGLDAGTGLLPRSTLFYRQSGAEYRIGIYLAPGLRALFVEGQEEAMMVPVPALVFYGQGTGYCVYALADDEWPTAGNELYRAPFPNVRTSGTICHGSVQFPPCSPETIHQAAELFFVSRFNADLSNNKSLAYPNSVFKMWQKMAEEKSEQYPIDDLVEAGKTLGDIVRE